MTKKTCPMCSEEHSRRGETCSNQCAADKRAQYHEKTEIICTICGSSFKSKTGRARYCDNDHYKPCEVCNEDFKIPKGKESKKNPTCGPKCGAVYSHRSADNKKKREQGSLAKWGVKHPFMADEVKKKIEKGITGTAGRFGTEASRKALLEMYGVENASSLEFVKAKKAETFKTNYTDKGIYPQYGPVSKINLAWKSKLEEATGVSFELEKYFSGTGRVDLFTELHGVKLAIEINPHRYS